MMLESVGDGPHDAWVDGRSGGQVGQVPVIGHKVGITSFDSMARLLYLHSTRQVIIQIQGYRIKGDVDKTAS